MESTTDTTERLEVRRELEIAASPETVWRFLVDPELSTRWWGASVVADGRPGGAYRVEVTPGNVARGEYLELDPPRRLVYTFGWESGRGDMAALIPPGSTVVEIDLVPSPTGTTLRLLHRGLPGRAQAESHAEGWRHYLGRLALAAAGGDPGPDPWRTGDM